MNKLKGFKQSIVTQQYSLRCLWTKQERLRKCSIRLDDVFAFIIFNHASFFKEWVELQDDESFNSMKK